MIENCTSRHQRSILQHPGCSPVVFIASVDVRIVRGKENIVVEKPKKMMLAKKEKIEADDDLDWGDASDLLLP